MGIFGWSYPPGADNDPFAPYNQDADWSDEEEKVRDALKPYDTKRWDREEIDCCLTGKNADLEEHGQQGITVVSCDDEHVKCKAHIGKTFAGDDAALNLAPDEDANDELSEKATQAYLEQAQEVVSGCDVPGDWDGDSWYLAKSVDFEVPWTFKPGDTGEPDYDETAKAIIKAGSEQLAPIAAELALADGILDILAGWAEKNPETNELRRCEAGHPGSGAAWRAADES